MCGGRESGGGSGRPTHSRVPRAYATLQLSAGTHFMQVSKWLGHSTFTLTLDVYGDYIPEQGRRSGEHPARAAGVRAASRGRSERRAAMAAYELKGRPAPMPMA